MLPLRLPSSTRRVAWERDVAFVAFVAFVASVAFVAFAAFGALVGRFDIKPYSDLSAT